MNLNFIILFYSIKIKYKVIYTCEDFKLKKSFILKDILKNLTFKVELIILHNINIQHYIFLYYFCFCILKVKKYFFLFFFNYFIMLISKIKFKKYYFNIFSNKIYFRK